MPIDIDLLVAQLTRSEGVRLRLYVDTEGKQTIGIGRNLTDVGISRSEADFMLRNDIARAIRDLDRELPWWRKLSEPRQRVLADMCFNMGIGEYGKTGLLSFTNTLRAIEHGDYLAAAMGLLKSKWAEQVGDRATRLAKIMESGDG